MTREDWSEPESDPLDELEEGEAPLDRVDVALRAVYSLLFAIAFSMMNSLLAVLVVFQLIYSFITEKLPGDRVQRFGLDLADYYGQILRYLTHNDSRLPFPFSDFPEPGEPGRPAYGERRERHAPRRDRRDDPDQDLEQVVC